MRNKLRLYLLAVLFYASFLFAFTAGEGTVDDPYQISTRADLEEVNSSLTASYILINNIDLADVIYNQAVIAASPAAKFYGTFNGSGFAITNLTINGDPNDFSGLFGFNDGVLTNIGVENCNISGYRYVGSLAGINEGTITNCYATGEVDGEYYIGGLVGHNSGGTITNCYAVVTVTGNEDIGGLVGYNRDSTIANSYAAGAVSGDSLVGGLVGENYWASITNCYAGGAVSGGYYAAGLAGINILASIQNCYASGVVSGDYFVGGLVSYSRGSTIEKCFWDKQTSWQTTSAGGRSKTTEQMMLADTFTGWNNGIWKINDGNDYPRLEWENSDGVIIETDLPGATYVGEGTDISPFILVSAEDIVCMSERITDWNKFFVLDGDIDMAGQYYSPPINFEGSFDGQGFTIMNLVIHADLIGNNSELGLFGKLSGNVRNLGLLNISVQGSLYIGGLAGIIEGSITNCYATGIINGDYYVGGLVGYNSYGTIANSFTSTTVNGLNNYVGGLIGYHYYGTVTNSYAAGNVSGSSFVGGLIGINYRGKVAMCYSTGRTSGTSEVGGLVGKLSAASSYEDVGNFWDMQSSEISNSVMGVGITTAQMQDTNTLISAGWDFVNETDNGLMDLWYCLENEYPKLYWQAAKGDLDYNGTIEESDLFIMATQWLSQQIENQRLAGDINEDGIVDTLDLGIMAWQWLAAKMPQE